MDDFLDINQDWFSKKYLPLLGRRFWSFKISLNIFHQLNGQAILETGCVRLVDDWPAGMSTLVFADYAKKYQKKFDSIDISNENIETAKKCLGELKEAVVFHLGDSLKLLKEWEKPVDLLYLDSLDTDPNDEVQARKAQEHQLAELEAIGPNLSAGCVVVLDDNYFQNGGKTQLAKELLSKEKFLCLMDFESSVWIRGS